MYEVVLAAREGIEYKYHLEKGAAMFYAWTAAAPVIYDFHGERSGLVSDGGPSSESYDKGTRERASGSFAAPFGGIHGWYWENPGTAPVTVRLTTSGFYNSAVVIQPNGDAQAARSPAARRTAAAGACAEVTSVLLPPDLTRGFVLAQRRRTWCAAGGCRRSIRGTRTGRPAPASASGSPPSSPVVKPCPHRPLFASGRFANGHS